VEQSGLGAMKKLAKSTEARSAAPSGSDSLTAKSHTELFARGMKLFSAAKYREAAAVFEDAASGPLMSVNESAAMYRRMCLQRIGEAGVQLQSAEDHYTYGVSLLNTQKWLEAKAQLELATGKSPQPHYLYALALADGMLGLVSSAVQNFRRAVLADPGIRAVARNDADFAPLLEHASIREVLSGDPASK
jgi:tetratricopeptide (TPR) repeat protein